MSKERLIPINLDKGEQVWLEGRNLRTTTPPPAPQPLPSREQVGRKTQLSQKQKRMQASYGMQTWPVQHKTYQEEERRRRCLSEPLPETDSHHLAPLTRFTVWVAPWGETIHTVSNQVPHKKARLSRAEWTANYQEWRAKLT